MLDLSAATNCIQAMREQGQKGEYRVGVVREPIPGMVSLISGHPLYQKGEVVVFRHHMHPSDGEMQMGEYRGMVQRPTGRLVIEVPLTPEEIDKKGGRGILTRRTMVDVPERYVSEVKV